jgi:putative FmdB family regulatory protein
MPIYEYRCQTCGRQFEKLRRMAVADKELECPDCQSKKVERKCPASPWRGVEPAPAGVSLERDE